MPPCPANPAVHDRSSAHPSPPSGGPPHALPHPAPAAAAPHPPRAALALGALAALTAALALAPAAPAAVRSNVLINVSGTHTFGALGVYAIRGGASITSTQSPTDPCRLAIGSNTCRVLTIATVARATNGVNACSFIGATTVTVPIADTTTVDAIVIPGNPIQP